MTDRQAAGDGDATREAFSGWHDEPITAAMQDQLERVPFAERVARLIDANHRADSSVVYGLEGHWGSGKSSLIALVTSQLKAQPDTRWRVGYFTPWATSDTAGLISEFFATLGSLVPETDRHNQVRQKIAFCAEIARPVLTLIPIVGDAASQAAKTVQDRQARPWKVVFDEVASELLSMGGSILIVVDDIDRLQRNELLELLKVVRLLGRFPGVDFLLAYDDVTIVETINDSARGAASKVRARAFMEKIVQYPLHMPPLLTNQIVKMLEAGLRELMAQETSFEAQRISDVILTTMPAQLSTPRAVSRFLAQVQQRLNAPAVEELNAVDLVLATFVRVQFPDLYGSLQRWKSELTQQVIHWPEPRGRDEAPDWGALLQVVDEEHDRLDAESVLRVLFPVMAGRTSTAPVGRFAHPDYFDRYLIEAIPAGDIPDADVSDALTAAGGGDAGRLRALLTDTEEERVLLALRKIRERYPDVRESRLVESSLRGPVNVDLVSAVMGMVSDLKEDHTSFFSPTRQATYWMADVLQHLLERVETGASEVHEALLACSQPTLRVMVISAVLEVVPELSPRAQEAVHAVQRLEVDRIAAFLLDDLHHRGVDHPREIAGPYLYEFVDRAGELSSVGTKVRAGLDAGNFSLEEVAARFVRPAYAVGTATNKPWMASFENALFTRITGRGAQPAREQPWTFPDDSLRHRQEFAAEYVRSLGLDQNADNAEDQGDTIEGE